MFYEWDFGDGATAYGKTVKHIYSQPGEYTARVTAMSYIEDVSTDEYSVTIIVAGAVPPEASFDYSPQDPQLNQEITFSATPRILP